MTSRRRFIATFGAVSVASLAGCSTDDGNTDTPTEEPDGTGTPTETETPTEIETPTETETDTDTPAETETVTAPSEQSFSGSGATVEEGINIEGGLVVIEATHNGESNFQVSLVNDTQYDDLFINVIGEFDGAQADLIDAGEYLLEIDADGDWDVTVRQPRSESGDPLPASFTGSNPNVIGPVEFSGTGVATGAHDGESNFIVSIYPSSGTFGEELVFNEIGSFEGEATYSFDSVGWVDIDASGSWSLDFE